MPKYDLTIIGSGPCGYVAGIRAAQLGAKVCIIEKDKLGGTCLNYGCIPTKTLIFSGDLFSTLKASKNFGILADNVSLDFTAIQKRKEDIIKRLRSGVEFLLKSRKVEIRFGHGRLVDKDCVEIEREIIKSKNILLATGSIPMAIKGIVFDKKDILSSTDLLEIDSLPRSLTIIGGGVIGCEFANLFNQLGTKVTIVELTERLLPSEDLEIARTLEVSFRKRGIEIYLGSSVSEIKKDSELVTIRLSDNSEVISEKVILCVGRSAAAAHLGLEKLGIRLNRGYIVVSEDFKTDIEGIFAAGDAIGKTLLAHAASEEGIAVVENLFGKKFRINYNAIPNCIYTRPEIASIGITEKEAEDSSIATVTRKFRYQSLGRSHIAGETEGFIKLVVEQDSDKVAGCQIIGPHATDIIGEMSLAIEAGITSERLASVIHPHPSFSEIIGEVAKMIHGRGIHSL